MSFTADELARLDRAIAKGVRKVEYEDRSVTYHSLSEMLTLRSAMRAELDLANGQTNRRRRVARYDKGIR